jgi:hypothetical protein
VIGVVVRTLYWLRPSWLGTREESTLV